MTMRNGVMADPDTLVFERRFDVAPAALWSWIIDPDKRAKWLAGGEWELNPGGRLEFVFRNGDLCLPGDSIPAKYADSPDEVRLSGELIAIDEPHHVEFAMIEPDGTKSRVRIELVQDGEGTCLRLTQYDLSGLSGAGGIAAGWHTHLDIFSAVAAGETPPSFWPRFGELEAAYGECGPPAA